MAVMGVFVVVDEGGGERWLLLGEMFLGGRGRGRGVLEDCWSWGMTLDCRSTPVSNLRTPTNTIFRSGRNMYDIASRICSEG